MLNQRAQIGLVAFLALVFLYLLVQVHYDMSGENVSSYYARSDKSISFTSNSSFYKVLDRVLRAFEKQDTFRRDIEETRDLLSQLDLKMEQMVARQNDYFDSLLRKSPEEQLIDDVPLYVITPTYPRMTQLSEITRLGMALKNTRNLKWLVVEDAKKHNEELVKVLDHIGIPYIYLQAPMPKAEREKKGPAKGVSNRNKGVEWLLENGDENGVFYFADDDNTYDSQVFTEIRKTKSVSVFPIGFIGSYLVDTPVVRDGRVTGFHVAWDGNRQYPIDMAQFAVKVKTLLDAYKRTKDVTMPYILSYEETKFLAKMGVKPLDMEPLADNCTKILVWHTRTHGVSKTTMTIDLNKEELKGSNMEVLNKYLNNVLYTLDRD